MTEIPIWEFAMGDDSTCLEKAQSVRVPHTWGIHDGTRGKLGLGWYRTQIDLAPVSSMRTFLRFRGAYRDTRVWVNGAFAGEHLGSGYTPFVLDVTKHLEDDASAEITVSVDNRPSESAIPIGKSFDWPDDGGLIRPVEWYQTGPVCISGASVNGMPVLAEMNVRNDHGAAFFHVHCTLDGDLENAELSFELYAGAEGSCRPLSDTPIMEETICDLQPEMSFSRILEHARYWHFDRPELYTLRLVLYTNGIYSDEQTICFGFRQLRMYGPEWRLNGEPVRLPGMEWMPGSDPRFGLAESREVIEKMLSRLRACSSVLTRFHWQQDDWVLDWCDRHGLLVQEEVPLWGTYPTDPARQAEIWPVLRQQISEMIEAHRSHPCIFAWGIGNELAANTWPSQQLIRKAVGFVHELDPARQANYVTSTAWNCPRSDGTSSGDVMMINDYIGTWHTGVTQMEGWQALIQANPGRVMVTSEFGLCEPAFPGGDAARTRIFLEKMACYRQFPQIAGTICFSLNDYRTHMGEAKVGADSVRIHGSTDLTGTPKPSFFTIQREYCPIKAHRTAHRLTISCRNDIPAYTVKGYIIHCGSKSWQIPPLRPGESWILLHSFDSLPITICRPDGCPVLVL